MDKKKLRVLVIGAAWYGDWAKGFWGACKRMGIDADIVYNNSVPAPLGGNSASVTNLFEKAKSFVRSFSPKFVIVLKKLRLLLTEWEILMRAGRVDKNKEVLLVIFVWTPMRVHFVEKLKRKGATTVLWQGEPACREDWWEPSFPHFDHVFIVDSHAWTENLLPENRARFKVLPLSSDESIFFPLPEKDLRFSSDIVFVGLCKPFRADFLSGLKDYDLAIYGYGWEAEFEKHPWLKKAWKGPLPTENVNAVYNNAKIVIGTLAGYVDQYTTSTQRTFDAALAGAFQVSENIALTREIFGDNVAFYSSKEDLVSVVKYYLEHEQEREQKAQNAMLIAKDHSYSARAAQILKECGLGNYLS